jgi:hypothetical protein
MKRGDEAQESKSVSYLPNLWWFSVRRVIIVGAHEESQRFHPMCRRIKVLYNTVDNNGMSANGGNRQVISQ